MIISKKIPAGVSKEVAEIFNKENGWIYVSGSILRGRDTGYSVTINKSNDSYYLSLFKYSENGRELMSNYLDECITIKRRSYSEVKTLFKNLTGFDYLDDRVDIDVFLDKFRDIFKGFLENSAVLYLGNSAQLVVKRIRGEIRVCSFIGDANSIDNIKKYIDKYTKDYPN